MSNPEVILNLPPILNAENTYKSDVVDYNAEIVSQCSIDDKDVCSNSVSDFPMISIVNSSDVIIGSVTQFHGPVTIVQQVPSKEGIEDKKNEADMVATDYKAKTPPKKPTPSQHCLPKRLLLCFAVLTLLIALIVLSIILMLEQKYEETDRSTYPDNLNASDNTTYHITNHNFYTIAQWGGREPTYRVPVSQPIEYVIISHTVGVFCENFITCSAQMRVAQDYHVTKDEPNVGYNFVIGGDGAIYEGRGWTTKNYLRDSTISISFIGNFVHDELTINMVDALLELLQSGLTMEVLPDDYRLVAHNQTAVTLSPGKNVYEVIKNLPNFYPDLIPVARG